MSDHRPITPADAERVLAGADMLYSEFQVEAAMDTMAIEMTRVLKGSNPVLVGVMLGGVVPLSGLLMRLEFPLQLDYLHATRYGGGTRGGDLHWLALPGTNMNGRVVVVVDDILDEGVTLKCIVDACHAQGAEAVYSAVLLEKRHARKSGLEKADFTGLSVEDRYVFGYGMDYHGYLRNARGIYAVSESEA